jgi:hypothetical protein
LEGGSVDSLRFTVTTTSSSAGTRRIDAAIPWQDANNAASTGTATTGTAGFGSITVETPVDIRITTTTHVAPNPGEANVDQPFDVRVLVENTGQADARDVAIAMTSDGSSAIAPITPITEVAGGQTVAYDLGVVASSTTNPNETLTT